MGFPSREPLTQMAYEEDDGLSIGYQQDATRLAFIAQHEQRGQKVLQQAKLSQQVAGTASSPRPFRPNNGHIPAPPFLPAEKQVLPAAKAQDLHQLLDVMLEAAADSDAEAEPTLAQRQGPAKQHMQRHTKVVLAQGGLQHAGLEPAEAQTGGLPVHAATALSPGQAWPAFVGAQQGRHLTAGGGVIHEHEMAASQGIHVTQQGGPGMSSQWDLTPPSQPLFHTLQPVDGGQQPGHPRAPVSSQALAKAPWLQYTGTTQTGAGKSSNRRGGQKGTSKVVSPSRQTAGSKRKPATAIIRSPIASPSSKGITSSAVKRLHGAAGGSTLTQAAARATEPTCAGSMHTQEVKDPLALLLAGGPRATTASAPGHAARKQPHRQKAPSSALPSMPFIGTPSHAAHSEAAVAAHSTTNTANTAHSAMTLQQLLGQPTSCTANKARSDMGAAAPADVAAAPQQGDHGMAEGRSSGRSFGMGAIMDDLLQEDDGATHQPPSSILPSPSIQQVASLHTLAPQQPHSQLQASEPQQNNEDCILPASGTVHLTGCQTPLAKGAGTLNGSKGPGFLNLGATWQAQQQASAAPSTPAWPLTTPSTLHSALQPQPSHAADHAALHNSCPSTSLQLPGSKHHQTAMTPQPRPQPPATSPHTIPHTCNNTPQGLGAGFTEGDVTPVVTSKVLLRHQSAVKTAFLSSVLSTPASSQQAPAAAARTAGNDADWWGAAGLLAVQARTGSTSGKSRDRVKLDGFEAVLKQVTANLTARQQALTASQQHAGVASPGALLCTVQQRVKEANTLKLAVLCDQLPEGQGWVVLAGKTHAAHWESLQPGSRLLVHPPYKEVVLQQLDSTTRVVLASCSTLL